MNLVFFTHPEFLGQKSMIRFANMLTSGMRQRGHRVENWFPIPIFFRFPCPDFLRKWFGYIDQYVLFPLAYRRKIKATPKDTLFVFADQALGPWVPLVLTVPTSSIAMIFWRCDLHWGRFQKTRQVGLDGSIRV